MSTGKIDRPAVVAQPKRTEKATAPVPLAKVEEVKAQAPENLFGARSKTLDPVTGPDGKVVATTASTNALWGEAAIMSAKPPLSALTLKNLTPAQAKAKMAELTEKKADLEQRIDGRAQELDGMWDHTLNSKRCEILKGYMAESNGLQPDTRASLEDALKKTDAAQTHLNGLQVQAKALGPSHGANPGTPEERHDLAVKLWAARHASTAAVETATKTVDAAGLKIERLALTESAIDPSRGANSKYGSMLGLVGQYFECNFMIDSLNKLFFTPTEALVKEMDREAKEAAKRRVIEDSWRERDDMMRVMLKELSAKDVNAKRDAGGRVQKATRTGTIDAAKLNVRRS